jgi:hypothetical protein
MNLYILAWAKNQKNNFIKIYLKKSHNEVKFAFEII